VRITWSSDHSDDITVIANATEEGKAGAMRGDRGGRSLPVDGTKAGSESACILRR
jgi:hypothetical protein